MLTLIALPSSFASSTFQFTGLLFDDFKGIFFIAAGIIIGLGIFASLFKKEEEEN